MATIPVSPIHGKCQLKMDGSPIVLTVTVGSGQLSAGSYDIKPTINVPATASGPVQSGVPIPLGEDRNLSGQRLSLLVTVLAVQPPDKNTKSLDTNIRFDLEGGKSKIDIALHCEATTRGDVVAYEAYIKFTQS